MRLAELRDVLRTSAAMASIWRQLNQLDLTVKNKRPSRRTASRCCRSAASAWRYWLTLHDFRLYVFVDACGVTTDLLRRYLRSPRGTRLHDRTPCGHWQMHTLIAALLLYAFNRAHLLR